MYGVTGKTGEETGAGEVARGVREWLARYPPGEPVVVVPIFNAYADVVECIESLLTHTDPSVPLLLLDDGSSDDRIGAFLSPLAVKRGFHYARKPTNDGFVVTMNLAFASAAPRDVVLVNSDVIVPPAWLGRLRAAAYARSTIATATPLSNYGSILSIPYRNTPINHLPRGLTVDELDRRIHRASEKRYPIIPTAIGHCTYFRRDALTAVGSFDLVFSPGYGEEVDFSQRAVMAGFCHVAVDDLFVLHKGSRSFASERSQERETRLRRVRQVHERKIATRYPWYHPWVRIAERDQQSPLALALDVARIAALGMHVGIDATSITGVVTGTQTVTLELARALCLTKGEGGRVSLIVNDGVDARHLGKVDEVVDDIVTLSALRHRPHPSFDLIHRPFQVNHIEQLQLLRRVAHRCVVSHLDFISFANPAYFPRLDDWIRYRVLTKSVLGSVDGVLYISENAMHDADHHGIDIPEDRACVTYVGIDHREMAPPAKDRPAIADLIERPFIAVLGTNFHHKNRVYAIRLFTRLVECHGWPGTLVFAGPKVGDGGSDTEEALERLESGALAARIRYLEHLDDADKWWLLRRAALVLYPSINEGFGIVPFEAAEAGTPTLSTRYTSLAEVLGDEVLSLALHDVDADAATAWSILADPAVAARQTERIGARGERFTWREVAQRTWAFYERVLHMPRRPIIGSPSEVEEALRRAAQPLEDYRSLQAEYRRLEEWAAELNARLVSEPLGLSPEPLGLSARVVGRLQTLVRIKRPSSSANGRVPQIAPGGRRSDGH